MEQKVSQHFYFGELRSSREFGAEADSRYVNWLGNNINLLWRRALWWLVGTQSFIAHLSDESTEKRDSWKLVSMDNKREQKGLCK